MTDLCKFLETQLQNLQPLEEETRRFMDAAGLARWEARQAVIRRDAGRLMVWFRMASFIANNGERHTVLPIPQSSRKQAVYQTADDPMPVLYLKLAVGLLTRPEGLVNHWGQENKPFWKLLAQHTTWSELVANDMGYLVVKLGMLEQLLQTPDFAEDAPVPTLALTGNQPLLRQWPSGKWGVLFPANVQRNGTEKRTYYRWRRESLDQALGLAQELVLLPMTPGVPYRLPDGSLSRVEGEPSERMFL